MKRAPLHRRIRHRAHSAAELIRHFVRHQKALFIPLLLILLVASLLLLLTTGISYVAPFVYALF